jgi:hypothetical protein
MDSVITMDEVIAMGNAIAETAALIDVATHRFLTQIREFDRVGAWHRTGALSCAHWLSWRIGIDLATAREKVRIANRLVELPRIEEALRAGEISYSKVRAMSRVATPANEEDLLGMARVTTGAQLSKICRLKARVNRIERDDPDAIEECKRYVLQHSTDDGMVSIQVRLLPEEAARVMRAFEVFGAGNLADGAVAVAEQALLGGRSAAAQTEETPAPPAASGRPPVEVVLHVSAVDLEGETPLGDGIPPAVARRLLCDCGVVPVLEDEQGRLVDVGRKKRTLPAALRRALDVRDGGCRFPGCTNRLFTDGHHLLHWIHGGETTLGNTVLLCRRHHRYVHEYGFSVEWAADAGEGVVEGVGSRGRPLIFRDPEGRVVPPHGYRPPVTVDARETFRGWSEAPITPETNAPGWDGLHVDYDLCLEALRERPRPSGAEGTSRGGSAGSVEGAEQRP